MRRIFPTTILSGILLACAACGCTSHGYRIYPSSYPADATPKDETAKDETAKDETPKDPVYVMVDLDGDVRLHGPRKIKRELSKEAVLEAAGGFGGLSSTPPKSITLIRAGQKYVVPFTEMGQGKWKGFLLEEGDQVIVNWQLF
jgi:hypothetical protein